MLATTKTIHPAPVRSALRTWLLFAGMAGSTLAVAQAAPSFDCSKARTPTELSICASPQLALLDGILGRYYAQARGSLPRGQRACLVADQRAWLVSQRDVCDTEACLERAYLRRVRALEGLLTGMALDRRLERFPAEGEPPLLTIVPAGDASGVPEDQFTEVILDGTPLEDEGGYLLVDGDFDLDAWHDYLDLQGDLEGLRARFGDGPIVIPGIVGGFGGGTLDARARAAIDGVAARGGRLRVTGRADYVDAAPHVIDSGECAFVYLLGPP
ncbi:lysozyme inhibitor LprI family protein [Luteimonas saliphila]|uniref:lysozyme inhibitor LprI family protein n=1 Tax=Luteimonas saliphila TaxID=2804919 RepID=UPI00192D66BB|nr:lysozyme inhibitor LprI family protein [Luteimonas saliphila]